MRSRFGGEGVRLRTVVEVQASLLTTIGDVRLVEGQNWLRERGGKESLNDSVDYSVEICCRFSYKLVALEVLKVLICAPYLGF